MKKHKLAQNLIHVKNIYRSELLHDFEDKPVYTHFILSLKISSESFSKKRTSARPAELLQEGQILVVTDMMLFLAAA